MPQPMDENQFRKYLAAFADGELDVEQNLRVLEHMAMNPQATRRVMHQQQLRQAVQKHVLEQSPDVPEALRARIAALLTVEGHASAAPSPTPPSQHSPGPRVDDPREFPASGRSVIGYIGRWLPAAVAAVLLVSAVLVYDAAQKLGQPTGGREVVTVTHMPLLEPDRAERWARRHETCAKETQRLAAFEHSRKIAEQLEELPETFAAHLKVEAGSLPSLDLTSIGYAFQGAGRCRLPGTASVHLVYRPLDPARHHPVSLWVAPYTGEPKLGEGNIYRVTPVDTQLPVVLWRQGDMMYYLLGQTIDEVENLARQIRLGV